MILIIDYGLADMKYSLWHNNSLLKVSIRERTDRTDFALTKLLEKAYEEYVTFAREYLDAKPNVNPIEKTIVIASKHSEHTKSKVFDIEYLKDNMSSEIKELLIEKVTTDITGANSQEPTQKKKQPKKLNVYNYTEQLIDNDFNYTQNILGVACNTDYLYKITIALYTANITNYIIADPTQVLSYVQTGTEPTLLLDIGYNTYYEIVSSDIMENGAVISNIVKSCGAIKAGTKLFDSALLAQGHTQDSIWNEKFNNTYSDLSSTTGVDYADIVNKVNDELALFAENERKAVTNIMIIGAGSNQEGVVQYLLDNIKGTKPPRQDGKLESNTTFKLKYVEAFKEDLISKMPKQIKNYLIPSYAALRLYRIKTQTEEVKEDKKGKLINYLDTESNFTKTFKHITTLKSLVKYLIPISIAVTIICLSIVAQWYVYGNLSKVLEERAATIAGEKTNISTNLEKVNSELKSIETDLLAETYDWSKVLNAIAMSTPKGVQITEIKTDLTDSNIIYVKGFSDSRFKIADMSTLLKDSIFLEAEIQDIKSKETLIKQNIQEFIIKCNGKKE